MDRETRREVYKWLRDLLLSVVLLPTALLVLNVPPAAVIAIAVVCLVLLKAWERLPYLHPSRRKLKMMALAGMIIFGAAFCACSAWYFWAAGQKTETAAIQKPPAPSPQPAPAAHYDKAEIDRRITVLNAYYDVMTGPAWDAYVLGHQLRNEWDGRILTGGPTQFANQLQEFANKVAIALNTLAGFSRKYGLYEDIVGPLNRAIAPGSYSSATRAFMDAVRALPEKPARETVQLVAPQRQAFNASIDEYGKWIEDMKALIARMKKTELERQAAN